jgi:DNA ligase-associated metallophosphoesterase
VKRPFKRRTGRASSHIGQGEPVSLAGASLVAELAGALYWPHEGLLAVADLHLEKGSSFAVRCSMLPPYDTQDTLERLRRLIDHYNPRCVIALGDSFHDRRGGSRLSEQDRTGIKELQRGREWIWITGNHDPDPMENIAGTFVAKLAIGPLTFRHDPTPDGPEGEIAGHLHPVARVGVSSGSVRRRCFIHDGRRMIMPALGAYAGGLNVRDRAFAKLFDRKAFTVHVLGTSRVYEIGALNCLPD